MITAANSALEQVDFVSWFKSTNWGGAFKPS
jgi:hypothetical protein